MRLIKRSVSLNEYNKTELCENLSHYINILAKWLEIQNHIGYRGCLQQTFYFESGFIQNELVCKFDDLQ
jgi:hypothetical protein